MKIGFLARASLPLLIADAALLGLAVFFGVGLVREVTRSRPVPAPHATHPPAAAAVPPPEVPAAANDRLDAYNVIVAKHLFNPSRAESQPTPTAAATIPLPPKPALHGVILDGAASIAYLEDPTSHRVLTYRVGDAVAGGKLEQIGSDRILIQRADGPMHVLLNDPGKPKAAAGTDPAQPAQASRASTRASSVREGGRPLPQPQQQSFPPRPVRTPRGLPEPPPPGAEPAPSQED